MNQSRRDFLKLSGAVAALPVWLYAKDAVATRGIDDLKFIRRVTLDLAGRIPTPPEARKFWKDQTANKREQLVERLLASEDFADYWTMRLCDILRVKSEFPINLWPNAVYVYHRFLHEAVKNDMPWDQLAARLITAKGSDFRDAESNYVRATADRSPAGLARTAVKTFLDEDIDKWSVADRARAVEQFAAVRVKSTREWKEELVYTVGKDRRSEFVAELLGPRRERFAAAFAGYVNYWFYGKKNGGEGAAVTGNDETAGGFSLKSFCRKIVLSPEYARSPSEGFPLRRMDAEVLEDALYAVCGLEHSHQSIAPEPFTFLPKDRKAVLIEDGSITSAFLAKFGRPPRDSGDIGERLNAITSKQRLFLMNSARLYNHLGVFRKMKVEQIYWKFLSRPPRADELKVIRERRLSNRDLAWCLVNSKEFLYRT